jgi:membrane protein YdbS with pleckstrin-like domain
MEKPALRIGQEFGPSTQLKKLYYLYLIGGVVILGLFWLWILTSVELLEFIVPATLIAAPFMLVPAILVAWWIPKYWKTIKYKLSPQEMVWQRGVWFRMTGIVPYNRITNIDIVQGPVSRAFRIASLKIQTAGYSAPSGRTSEIMINGMENFVEIREVIMSFVRGGKPVATAATYETGPSDPVLGELVKIRKLLEKGKK